MSVRCEIKNYKLLKKQIEDMQKAPKLVLKRITADAKARVPGWVATEVTKEYGVKKGDITGQKIGKVKAVGKSFDKVKILYLGRLLTPARFSMTPKVPKANRGTYTLKAAVIKGQKKPIGKVKKLTKKQSRALVKNFRGEGQRNSPESPYMLQKTGAKSADKIQYIPFQRRTQPGAMQYVMRTVSLPQMVSSKRTEDGITRAINEGLGKRLDQHMKLLQK